ncbi:MAG: putative CRISPR-associated protein [Anaerolineae bacterium]|nr:putative CRISPR-associated protein [Anaerolineae bacterium]
MPYCIISTVGQTVITNSDTQARDFLREFGRQRDVDLKAIAGNKLNFPGEQWYSIVMASLRAKANDVALLRRASAELNHLVPTLQDQPPNRNDCLHFLASETPDGVLAARILADFCKEYFQRETQVEIIEGLQVENGDRFRRKGLNNLISKVFSILRRAPAGTYQRIINPTGGFKGVVPYLTLIGMLENVELSYIYESSSEMIRLAPVPLRLDFEQMEAAYEALVKCSNPETPLTEAELRKALGNEDQPVATHPLWSLFDFIDDNGETYYEPSGLGHIVIEHFRDKQKSKLYLSKQAQDAIRALDSTQRDIWRKLLNRMRDPEWRSLQEHATLGGKVKIAKPASDERIFYFEEDDGSILIAEIARHSDDSYERLASRGLRRADYGPVMIWEGDLS